MCEVESLFVERDVKIPPCVCEVESLFVERDVKIPLCVCEVESLFVERDVKIPPCVCEVESLFVEIDVKTASPLSLPVSSLQKKAPQTPPNPIFCSILTLAPLTS